MSEIEMSLPVEQPRLVLGMHDREFTFCHVFDIGKHLRWERGGKVKSLVGATDHKPPFWRKAGKTDTRRVCEFVSENAGSDATGATEPKMK